MIFQKKLIVLDKNNIITRVVLEILNSIYLKKINILL